MSKNTGISMFSALLMLMAALLFTGLHTAHAAAKSDSKGEIPQPLKNIEDQAEDIFDLAAAAKWSRVSMAVTSISNSWDIYQPQAAAHGVSPVMRQSFSFVLGNFAQRRDGKGCAADEAIRKRSQRAGRGFY